jgi:CheY-like chemotaxis protein
MMNGFWHGTVFSKALERTTMEVQKVLVVDDEAPMLRVLRASLMLRGYNVVEAESGEEALDRFNGERCDLVLLDLNLPGIEGNRHVSRHSRKFRRASHCCFHSRFREGLSCRARGRRNDYVTRAFSSTQWFPASRKLAVPEGMKDALACATRVLSRSLSTPWQE